MPSAILASVSSSTPTSCGRAGDTVLGPQTTRETDRGGVATFGSEVGDVEGIDRQLTDEDGLAEHHRRLKLEIVSQVVIHPGGCPRCSMHIPQSAVVCEMCNFPVPEGFVYAPDPGGGVVQPAGEVAEV
ncbi:unnamed protein product [Ectocarpus sp. 8 AP-2014]